MRLSDNQRKRLVRQSWDEHVARLERMSTNQGRDWQESLKTYNISTTDSYNIIHEPNNMMTLSKRKTPQFNDITKLILGTGNIMLRSASVPGC